VAVAARCAVCRIRRGRHARRNSRRRVLHSRLARCGASEIRAAFRARASWGDRAARRLQHCERVPPARRPFNSKAGTPWLLVVRAGARCAHASRRGQNSCQIGIRSDPLHEACSVKRRRRERAFVDPARRALHFAKALNVSR
jgi:hypothetical protein